MGYWFYLIGGIATAFVATRVALLAGKFWVTLKGLKEPAYCSAAFLNPRLRWLTFYAPILAMTATAAWLMPHWGLSSAVVVWVVWSFFTGTHRAMDAAIARLAAEYVESEGVSHSEAVARATADLQALVRMPSPYA